MKIVIVDDDCLVTGALKTILEVNEDVDVVGNGAGWKGCCAAIRRAQTRCTSDGYSDEKHGWTGGGNGDFTRIS